MSLRLGEDTARALWEDGFLWHGQRKTVSRRAERRTERTSHIAKCLWLRRVVNQSTSQAPHHPDRVSASVASGGSTLSLVPCDMRKEANNGRSCGPTPGSDATPPLPHISEAGLK